MTNLTEHRKNIGKTGLIELEGFKIECTIIFIRQAFGRIDYQIAINGTEKWVDSQRVQVIANGRL